MVFAAPGPWPAAVRGVQGSPTALGPLLVTEGLKRLAVRGVSAADGRTQPGASPGRGWQAGPQEAHGLPAALETQFTPGRLWAQAGPGQGLSPLRCGPLCG